MAQALDTAAPPTAPVGTPARTARRKPASATGVGFGGWVWIAIVAVYFFTPLVATALFSLWAGGTRYNLDAYGALIRNPDMWASLWLSVRLAIYTVIITMALLIPTVLFVRLRAPKLRPLLELISILPFVIPAIALVQGLTGLYSAPDALLPLPLWFVSSPEFMVIAYVILALPYTYRALDVGITALDVHTLTQAAQNLGASWPQIFARIIIPNLRTAILGATLLTLAIVLGEFTFANILLFNTFAVYINYIGQTNGTQAAALSLFSFFVTWIGMLGILSSGSRGQVQAGGVS